MKLLQFCVCVVPAMLATPSLAAFNNTSDVGKTYQSCELNDYEAALRDQQWNQLAMRYFMATMEPDLTREEVASVHREVNEQLDDLKLRFGSACVLEIL